MKILDLFCGAGGSSMGYHRAWPEADIVGVDVVPQPNYPFRFIQADALNLPVNLDDFDLIHASPPCQVFSSVTPERAKHADLVDQTRALLAGRVYVIENVPQAPLVDPIQLCGTSFGLTADALGITWELRRHRIFETSFDVQAPECQHQHKVIGVYGHLRVDTRPNNPNRRPPFDANGRPTNDWKAGHAMANEVMGIDWMTPVELVQAIPPAYTEWLGLGYRAAGRRRPGVVLLSQTLPQRLVTHSVDPFEPPFA